MTFDTLEMLHRLLKNGTGVAYNKLHDDWRPLVIEDDGDTLYWWDDPDGCESDSFEVCVRKTHSGLFGDNP